MIRGPNLPHLVFLYGLAGVGKNFCADALAEAVGYKVYDLDAELTPQMREAISNQRSFTDEMRDEFFHGVSHTLTELKARHPWLIVTQGAYKRRHREMVAMNHPEMTFVWIDAPTDIIMNRLSARGDTVSPEYAASISMNFERPENGYTLLNDAVGEEILVERFAALFS